MRPASFTSSRFSVFFSQRCSREMCSVSPTLATAKEVRMTRALIRRGFRTFVAATAVMLAGHVAAAAPCGHRACGDEVRLSGLSGGAKSQCFKKVTAACNANTCDCGGSPNVCGSCGNMIDALCGTSTGQMCPPTTTTTTVATTTTTRPTTTTTVATTTTTRPTTTTTVATTTTRSTTTTIATCCGFAPRPTRLRFENTIGSGNCGTLTVSTGTVNLACGGLYFGGASETVGLPATVPDKGVSFLKITNCSGTTLTVA